jgi:RNA polymerase sigma-70 factor (ECF subfamily)
LLIVNYLHEARREECAMRDAPGFADFYQANYGKLVGVIAAMTGDVAEAEDIAQEAFARALARWHRLGGYDLPEAWLRKVALRIAIDSGRRARRAVLLAARLTAQRPAPAVMPDHFAGFAELTAALLQLPVQQREVLVLRYIADLPVDEIARERGLPPGTVKARLAAGRRRLQEQLPGPGKAVHDAR